MNCSGAEGGGIMDPEGTIGQDRNVVVVGGGSCAAYEAMDYTENYIQCIVYNFVLPQSV